MDDMNSVKVMISTEGKPGDGLVTCSGWIPPLLTAGDTLQLPAALNRTEWGRKMDGFLDRGRGVLCYGGKFAKTISKLSQSITTIKAYCIYNWWQDKVCNWEYIKMQVVILHAVQRLEVYQKDFHIRIVILIYKKSESISNVPLSIINK